MPEFIGNMSLIDVLSIIAIICIIVFLVKKAVGLAIGIIAILLIFQIGFRFTGQDIKDNADKYLEPDAANAVTAFFDDFAKRREENGVVDTEGVYDSLIDATGKVINVAKDVITPENIGKMADGIGNALRSAGVQDISMEELANIIGEKLGKAPDDPQVQEIAEKVQEQISVEG